MSKTDGKYRRNHMKQVKRKAKKRQYALIKNGGHTPIADLVLTFIMFFLTLVLLLAVVSCP